MDWDDVKFITKLICVFVIVLVILMTIFGGLFAALDNKQCSVLKQMHSQEYEFQYTFWGGGCLVKSETGRWIDADSFLQLEYVGE